MELSNTRALVVGASSGIGREIATEFVEEGAAVGFAARSTDELEAITSELEGETCVVNCDLQDTDSVETAVAECTDALGGLDVVVNSAGINRRGPLLEQSDADIDAVIGTNLTGAIWLSRAVLPELIESSGTLIHVSSEAGERGVAGLAPYCATKGGLNSLVEAIALEYADEGVTVNAISPGTTKTPMNEAVRERDPSWVEERASGIPLGRLGEPEDIAGAAVFLASDRSDFITGEIIAVDGGSTAG